METLSLRGATCLILIWDHCICNNILISPLKCLVYKCQWSLYQQPKESRASILSWRSVYIMSDGWAFTTPRISLMNHAIKSASVSSSPCPSLRIVAAKGQGYMFSMKWSSNSLANWAKRPMKSDFKRAYHSCVEPLNMVEKVRHIRASECHIATYGSERLQCAPLDRHIIIKRLQARETKAHWNWFLLDFLSVDN